MFIQWYCGNSCMWSIESFGEQQPIHIEKPPPEYQWRRNITMALSPSQFYRCQLSSTQAPLCLNRDASFSYVCELVLSRRILAWNRLKKRAENGFWIVVEHVSLEENTVSKIAANGLWGGQKTTYSNLEQLNLGCSLQNTPSMQHQSDRRRICPACNTNQIADIYLAF